MERSQFEFMKQKHGGYASWAVWAQSKRRPKSNIADLSIFDPETNPSLLNVIRVKVVMVGLNISRALSEPFRNFHDPNPRANDYKIRFAFDDTPYYGAYMTDIIKNVEMVNSADVMRYLRANPEVVRTNVETFRQELRDIGSIRPLLIAFGRETHKLLVENLPRTEYAELVRVTHYSYRISKEQYRRTVLHEFQQLNL